MIIAPALPYTPSGFSINVHGFDAHFAASANVLRWVGQGLPGPVDREQPVHVSAGTDLGSTPI